MSTTPTINEITKHLEAERDRLFQYACYRTGDKDDAEDALQDLYVQLSGKCGQTDIENLKGYSYRTLANICNGYLRKRPSNAIIRLEEASAEEISEITPENFEEETIVMNYWLGQLPDAQAETVRLRLHSELTFGEIAEITEVPVSTAKSRFRYAIEFIRDKFKQQGII